MLLVLLASLPSLALLFLTAAQQRSDALATGMEETQRLARLVAASQSNVSGQIELVLGTVAVLPQVQGNDRAECTSTLRGITSTDPEIVTSTGRDLRVDGASFERISVIDSDGDTFCSGVTGGSSLSPEDADLAATTISSGQVTRGNVGSDQNGSMIVTYVAPVVRADGEGRRAIVATLSVYALNAFAHEANLDPDSFVVIYDDDGVVEQQYPPIEESLVGSSIAGTPVVDSSLGHIAGNDESDDNEETDVDGVDYVTGFDSYWLPGSDGGLNLTHAMVATPESTIVRNASEKFNENLGKLVIAAVVAMIAAWVGADLFMGRDSGARKALVRDLYHAFATGNVQTLDQIVGPGFVDHSPAPGQAAGIDGLRQTIATFRGAFPDGRMVVRDLLADDDKVVARVSLIGTHQGDYFGVAPTGKPVSADGMETFRFANGMIVESWSLFSPLKMRNEPAVAVTPALPPADPPGWVRRILRRWRKPAPTST
jgi:predicted ester cyclase